MNMNDYTKSMHGEFIKSLDQRYERSVKNEQLASQGRLSVFDEMKKEEVSSSEERLAEMSDNYTEDKEAIHKQFGIQLPTETDASRPAPPVNVPEPRTSI